MPLLKIPTIDKTKASMSKTGVEKNITLVKKLNEVSL
jgi:hypothetical protein